MAITVAAFQTACDNCATAIAAHNWGDAMTYYAQAEAINAGLELEVSDGGARVRRRTMLDGVKMAIEAASSGYNKHTDNKRFGYTQTGFAPKNRR